MPGANKAGDDRPALTLVAFQNLGDAVVLGQRAPRGARLNRLYFERVHGGSFPYDRTLAPARIVPPRPRSIARSQWAACGTFAPHLPLCPWRLAKHQITGVKCMTTFKAAAQAMPPLARKADRRHRSDDMDD